VTGNANGTTLFSTVSEDGVLSFLASNDQAGTYELELVARTQTACPIANTTTFTVTVLPNFGPPILLSSIPDSTWQYNTILVPYNIRNYWFDPAGPVAFLQYAIAGNQNIGVVVGPTGEVTLTPQANFCGVEFIRYTATSPWTNLSTQSNLVRLEVPCPPPPPQIPSSGGGGGGGGPSAPPRACVEDVFCYEWSECQYTSAVTDTGNPLELRIQGVRGSQVYLVESMPEDVSIFYRGYRYRQCFDTSQCSTRELFYTDTCEYQPSCFDGIQNQNEQGIDCGGVCPRCPVEGLVVEEPVPPFITPPEREEQPVLIQSEDTLTILLFYFVLGLLLLIGLLLSLRSLVKSIIAKLVFTHKRKNRVLLLSIDAKQRILDALKDIESRVGKEPVIKLQEELSGVGREYFKEILGIDFEFTYEELVVQLKAQHVLEMLQDILEAFFARSSELEFSGKAISETVLLALINEVREIVYQTAVLSKDDYKELERDLVFRPISEKIPLEDRFYLLVTQAQIALQFGRVGVAQQTYHTLQQIYTSAPSNLQVLWYQDLRRLFLELSLGVKKEGSFFTKRGRRQ